MLVFTRKVGESFVIGGKIVVTVVRIAPNGVRIGIEAPSDCTVVRKELLDWQDEPSATDSSAADA